MTLDRIDIPESDAARLAERALREACDEFLVGHCERSFRFGMLAAEHDGADVDAEALYVGVLLHDMGLSRHHQGPERFEVRGANLARELLADSGWSPDRVETVWDIIALHTSREIARHKSPEANYANVGISIDIRGRVPDGFADADVRAVLDAFPRASFPGEMSEALIAEVRARPATTQSTWMEHIAALHVEGFDHPDFIAALRDTTDFS